MSCGGLLHGIQQGFAVGKYVGESGRIVQANTEPCCGISGIAGRGQMGAGLQVQDIKGFS